MQKHRCKKTDSHTKGVGICLFGGLAGCFAAGRRSCWCPAARKALILRRVTPTLWNRHPAPRIPDKGCLRLYNLEELFDIEGKFIINKEEGENRALLISATGVGIIIQTGHENDNDEAS